MKFLSSSNTGQKQKQKVRPSLYLSQRMFYVVAGSFVLVTVGLITYFQLAKIEKAHATSVGDYQTAATGDWTSTSTWARWNGSSWVTPAPSVPTDADGVITILNGHTVTVSSNVSGKVDQLVIAAGGILELTSAGSITVSNGAGTDLIVNGTLKCAVV